MPNQSQGLGNPPAASLSWANAQLLRATLAGRAVNDIGTPGRQGFGVGIAPSLPSGFSRLSGCDDPASDNYGNYQFSDGSVVVYIPAFFYKVGTGANGLGLNVVDVKPFDDFATVLAADAAGYALHRAFYNGGAVRLGVFVDKYLCSNNGGTASSIKGAAPISSAQRGTLSTATFAALTGAPANAYHGAIVAAKTRGARWFCNTRFIRGALALLSLAHGSASTSATHCGWYSTGATNYPKGCNNNALGDSNDGAIIYVSDGNGTYPAALTGSANLPGRVSHNGQACGVADLNGVLWEIELGLTSDSTNFYALKTSVDVAAVTSGTTLATDAWGAVGITAMYDNLGATYESLLASNAQKVIGSAGQVLSAATSGLAWTAAGAGIPLAGGVGGSNQFGGDGLWDYRPNQLCVISGGGWYNGGLAGVWALLLADVRSDSYLHVGLRAASYL